MSAHNLDNDPFAPDAPILYLLSLRDNPLLATATEDQIVALVKRLRTTAQQPQTLKAEVAASGRKASPLTAAKRAAFDAI